MQDLYHQLKDQALKKISKYLSSRTAVARGWGVLVVGLLVIRALLFWVSIRAPDLWHLMSDHPGPSEFLEVSWWSSAWALRMQKGSK